jgi:hypothetical protein
VADDDNDQIGWQVVSAMRREILSANRTVISRNSLPSPQRGQRPRNPRFNAVQTSRLPSGAESSGQTFACALTVSNLARS